MATRNAPEPDQGQLALREAYAGWLESVSWHTFGTFTFRQRRSVRRAGEIFRAFLEAGTGGCGEYFAASLVVWGSEPHKSGDGHVHALARWHPWCDHVAEAFIMAREWRARFGRVELARYDPTRGAAYYLTKYVLKDAVGSGEWDVWRGGDHAESDGLADGLALEQRAVPDGDPAAGWEWWEKPSQTQTRIDAEGGL